jgi:hypothetical protein
MDRLSVCFENTEFQCVLAFKMFSAKARLI